jgi:small subunit ribosomal protein S11
MVEEKQSKKVKKARVARKLTRGRAYIQSTYNNTIVTITDLQGNVIAWGSAGPLGFKGAKKSTPYAATQIVRSVVEKVKDTGLSHIDIFVRGIGGGRESAIRALSSQGLVVDSIKDVTPIPHNGCRSRKVRRV